MARQREFDTKETLDKAMRLFWRKGYAGTSMRDLVKHTGVAQAGLYTAFGDKKRLYLAALDHYNATYGEMLIGRLERADSGLAEIKDFFNVVIEGIKSQHFSNGCLMCNTGVEFGNDEMDILLVAQQNHLRMKDGFYAALTHARESGEISADIDPVKTSSFLTSVAHGIIVLARMKTDLRDIEETARVALGTLE